MSGTKRLTLGSITLNKEKGKALIKAIGAMSDSELPAKALKPLGLKQTHKKKTNKK